MPELPGRQRQHIGTSVKKASHCPESHSVWGTFFPMRRKRAKEEKDVFWTSSLSSIRNVLFVQALAYFHLGDFSCAPGAQPPVELHPRGLSSRAPRLLHGSDHAEIGKNNLKIHFRSMLLIQTKTLLWMHPKTKCYRLPSCCTTGLYLQNIFVNALNMFC